MIKAVAGDKALVVAILVNSFNDNKSVNHIIPQDGKRAQRIRLLMEYAFDVCFLFGDVLLTEDKLGCALLVKPELRRTTPKSVLLDIKFATRCLALTNIKKAMQREAAINRVHPAGLLYYLWFIGVDPAHQKKGIGSMLMKHIIAQSKKQNRLLCLETSTLENIPWYQRLGLEIYYKYDFGYGLFCMKQMA